MKKVSCLLLTIVFAIGCVGCTNNRFTIGKHTELNIEHSPDGTDANSICEWDDLELPDTENNRGTKTEWFLTQSVTYSVDYENQPSKIKKYQYNQDGLLTGISIEIVSKQTLYGEISYEEQLLEYYLECNESGCYSGFSVLLNESYCGRGTITCDATGRIVEIYYSETGQKHLFSYNTDGLICEYIYEYNGDVYTHSKMQYDSEGNIVSTERVQHDGSKTETRTEIEYDIGNVLIMTQYVNGVEQNSILQRCDAYGNTMKEELYRDGTMTGWIEYTYETQNVSDSLQKLPDLILTLFG